MPTEPLPSITRNMSLGQLTEAVGEGFNVMDFLLNGGLDSLNIRKITAEKITTGTLDAGKVTIRADLNSGAYITIDGSGMVVYNGTDETVKVDIDGFVTMTGALIQSSDASYPRVEIDPGTVLLRAAFTSTEILDILASYAGGPPGVVLSEGGNARFVSAIQGGAATLFSTNGYDLQVFSGNNLFLLANGGNLNLKATGSLTINGTPGFTGVYNDGTNTITVVKGIITSVV